MWQLAPLAVTVFCLYCVLQVLSHPEALLVVPLRILSGVQWYCSFVVDRLLQRLELEAMRTLFGHLSLPAPASSTETFSTFAGAPVTAPAQPGYASFGPWGWILALFALLRK